MSENLKSQDYAFIVMALTYSMLYECKQVRYCTYTIITMVYVLLQNYAAIFLISQTVV